MQEKAPTSMRSVRLEPTKLILIGSRNTYQATGYADALRVFIYTYCYKLLVESPAFSRLLDASVHLVLYIMKVLERCQQSCQCIIVIHDLASNAQLTAQR